MDFIAWYDLDETDVVEVQSRDNENVFENRTIYQALMQNVDIFGRPGKKFYEDLAGFADDENEKKTLLTLAGTGRVQGISAQSGGRYHHVCRCAAGIPVRAPQFP